jgi:hypothetical protein
MTELSDSGRPKIVLHGNRSDVPINSIFEAMQWVQGMAPGWDKHWLGDAYIAWANDKDVAINEDARFLSWVGSFTKGKPAP